MGVCDHIYININIYIYCPAFMIVEKVVLYICIFGHHGHSTNIHYWSELGTLRTLAIAVVNWVPYNTRYR